MSDYSNINNYILKDDIGEGNFGKVKIGIFKQTGEEFAVKILNKKKIKIKMKNTVFKENEIITKFNHVNVIFVFDIIEDDENYYIVMEYCKCGELFDYIVDHQHLEEDEAAMFFYQLINGVEYIHSLGVAHRDLKPENLLLTENKILKIIDFGLSHEFNGEEFLKTKCGSPSYAAPEIIKGLPYDGFKTDIWCCGIILYAMVCGYLPFEGENNKILFKSIVECNPEIPDYLNEDTQDLIGAILRAEPDDRITIDEIKNHDFYLRGKELCNIDYPRLQRLLNRKRHNMSTNNYLNQNDKKDSDIEFINQKINITIDNDDDLENCQEIMIIDKNNDKNKSKEKKQRGKSKSRSRNKNFEGMGKIDLIFVNKPIEKNNDNNYNYNNNNKNSIKEFQTTYNIFNIKKVSDEEKKRELFIELNKANNYYNTLDERNNMDKGENIKMIDINKKESENIIKKIDNKKKRKSRENSQNNIKKNASEILKKEEKKEDIKDGNQIKKEKNRSKSNKRDKSQSKKDNNKEKNEENKKEKNEKNKSKSKSKNTKSQDEKNKKVKKKVNSKEEDGKSEEKSENKKEVRKEKKKEKKENKKDINNDSKKEEKKEKKKEKKEDKDKKGKKREKSEEKENKRKKSEDKKDKKEEIKEDIKFQKEKNLIKEEEEKDKIKDKANNLTKSKSKSRPRKSQESNHNKSILQYFKNQNK